MNTEEDDLGSRGPGVSCFPPMCTVLQAAESTEYSTTAFQDRPRQYRAVLSAMDTDGLAGSRSKLRRDGRMISTKSDRCSLRAPEEVCDRTRHGHLFTCGYYSSVVRPVDTSYTRMFLTEHLLTFGPKKIAMSALLR